MDKEKILGKKADLLLRTGQLLIQSLADSNRVDRNLRRVALFMGLTLSEFKMHITYTTLTINLRDGAHSVTRLRKCSHHAVNMDIITEISHLSWRATKKNYTIEQYAEDLEKIGVKKKNYHPALIVAAAGLACGGLCKLFGGDLPAILITVIAAGAAMFIRQRLHKTGLNVYFTIVLTAFAATMLACLGTFTNISQTPQHPISACVLFLIPGVPMINCLDDMIDGFTIVGFTRAITASLTIAAISAGVIFALKFYNIASLGADLAPVSSAIFIIIAAAIAATGFAMIFNVPRHTLIMCAVIGAAAVLTRNFLHYYLDAGLALSTFTASVLVGLISLYVMHKVHVPIHVISVPAVIIMVPGVLLYKSMMGLISINSEGLTADKTAILVQTADTMITAGMTIIGLALGIVMASMVSRAIDARRWKKVWEEKAQSAE